MNAYVEGRDLTGSTADWDQESEYTWLGLDNIRLIPVEAPPAGYDGWVETFGLTGAHAAKGARPFGEMPNLLKYAFGLAGNVPAGPGQHPTAVYNRELGTMDFRFLRERSELFLYSR